MAKYYYAAFIPDEKGGYSIFCPDFPEVASQGDTVEECMDMAAEAVALTVEEYAKARHPLPEPCGLAEARRRIEKELEERLEELKREDKLLEAQRLEQRTNYDLEMLREMGLSPPRAWI